jgi:hypothetical protein
MADGLATRSQASDKEYSMTRNLKAFLLAVTAMMALTGVAASASQAALFHLEKTPATLTAKTHGTANTKASHQVFDAAGATVTCAGIEGHGAIKAGDVEPTSVTIDVKYVTPCTFVGQSATIAMNGCDYTFTSHGRVALTNATEKSCATEPITVTVPAPFCEVKIGSSHAGVAVNQNLGTVTYKNIGAGSTRELTIEPAVTEIAYIATGAGCPKTGTFTDGNYTTGNTFLTAEDPTTLAHIGGWWE